MHIQIPTPQDIAQEMKPLLQDFVNELTKNFQPKEPTEYLTRNELCEMFDIDLSTESRWRKAGKINAYGIGNRVYYLRSEIDELLRNSKL